MGVRYMNIPGFTEILITDLVLRDSYLIYQSTQMASTK